MPLIGDKAPSFKAVTTQGNIDFQKIIKENGLFYSHIHLILHQYVQVNLWLLQQWLMILKH